MFSLFRPKSPICSEAQAWVEDSFARLSAIPGERDLHETIMVLPNEIFFPDTVDAGEESLRGLFSRVCSYMNVLPDDVELRLYRHENGFDEEMREMLPAWELKSSGAAGLFQRHPELDKPIITIKIERQNDITFLIAAMAHELAHVRLLHQAGFDQNAPDMEPLTDLMTVHQGLGLFTANSAFQFKQNSLLERSCRAICLPSPPRCGQWPVCKSCACPLFNA